MIGATRRHLLVEALRDALRADITLGDTTWTIERGQLVDATRTGTVGRALPIAAPEPTADLVLGRHQIDEALCLARFFDKHAARLTVSASGPWTFPIADRVPELVGFARPRQAA